MVGAFGFNRLLIILIASLYGQVFSGYIDVYSHRFIFVDDDPILNPAHIGIFISTALAIYSSYNLKPYGFGFLVVFYGVVLQLFAGFFNEVFHLTIGDLDPVSPPHALLVVGMILSQLGLIISVYTIRNFHSMIYRILALSLLWATGLGSGMYVSSILMDRGYMDLSIYILSAITGLIAGGYIVIAPIFGFIISSWIYYIFSQIPLGFMAGIAYPPTAIAGGIILEVARKIEIPQSVKPLLAGALASIMLRVIHYPFLELSPLKIDLYLQSIPLGMVFGYIGFEIVKYLGERIK